MLACALSMLSTWGYLTDSDMAQAHKPSIIPGADPEIAGWGNQQWLEAQNTRQGVWRPYRRKSCLLSGHILVYFPRTLETNSWSISIALCNCVCIMQSFGSEAKLGAWTPEPQRINKQERQVPQVGCMLHPGRLWTAWAPKIITSQSDCTHCQLWHHNAALHCWRSIVVTSQIYAQIWEIFLIPYDPIYHHPICHPFMESHLEQLYFNN